jgi:hypothetical protein
MVKRELYLMEMIKSINTRFLGQIILLVLIFSISIIVRKPNFDKPIGRHHEWISAHTLITLKIWEHGSGPENYHFSPVYTFNDSLNKNIGILGGVVNEKGDYYYVSYPPFAFQLPYYFFKATGMPMSVKSLQVFSYLIHFCCSILVFYFISLLINKSIKNEFIWPAWIGFLLYVFSPGFLWFHSNVYFVDTLVQLFVIIQLISFYRILDKGKSANYRDFLFLFFASFLGVYTEWISLFVSFGFGLVLIFSIIFFKKFWYWKPLTLLTLSAVLSLSMTIFQYSSIGGFDQLMEVSLHKYSIRSGYEGVEGSEHGFSMDNAESYSYLKGHMQKNFQFTFQVFWVFLFLTIVFAFVLKRGFSRKSFLLLGVLLFGIIIHHLLFFNFNVVHDFSTLKTGLFIVLLSGVSSVTFIDFYNYNRRIKFIVLLILFVFIGVEIIQNVNRYKKDHNPAELNYYAYNVGNYIRQNVPKSELVFVDSWITPECMYYAERNYHSKKNISDAIELMKVVNVSNAVFIYTRNTDHPVDVYRISTFGDSVRIK